MAKRRNFFDDFLKAATKSASSAAKASRSSGGSRKVSGGTSGARGGGTTSNYYMYERPGSLLRGFKPQQQAPNISYKEAASRFDLPSYLEYKGIKPEDFQKQFEKLQPEFMEPFAGSSPEKVNEIDNMNLNKVLTEYHKNLRYSNESSERTLDKFYKYDNISGSHWAKKREEEAAKQGERKRDDNFFEKAIGGSENAITAAFSPAAGLLGSVPLPFTDKNVGNLASDVAKATGKGALSALENTIMRPGYGMANAMHGLTTTTDTVGKGLEDGKPSRITGMPSVRNLDWLTGGVTQGDLASTDSNPKQFVKDFWEGFKLDKKRTMADQIKENAKRDPRENIYDNSAYQAVAGFAGDVIYDPLTWTTFGAGTAAKEGSKAASRVASQLSKETTKRIKTVTEGAAENRAVRDRINAQLGRAKATKDALKNTQDEIRATARNYRDNAFAVDSKGATERVRNIDGISNEVVEELDSMANISGDLVNPSQIRDAIRRKYDYNDPRLSIDEILDDALRVEREDRIWSDAIGRTPDNPSDTLEVVRQDLLRRPVFKDAKGRNRYAQLHQRNNALTKDLNKAIYRKRVASDAGDHASAAVHEKKIQDIMKLRNKVRAQMNPMEAQAIGQYADNIVRGRKMYTDPEGYKALDDLEKEAGKALKEINADVGGKSAGRSPEMPNQERITKADVDPELDATAARINDDPNAVDSARTGRIEGSNQKEPEIVLSASDDMAEHIRRGHDITDPEVRGKYFKKLERAAKDAKNELYTPVGTIDKLGGLPERFKDSAGRLDQSLFQATAGDDASKLFHRRGPNEVEGPEGSPFVSKKAAKEQGLSDDEIEVAEALAREITEREFKAARSTKDKATRRASEAQNPEQSAKFEEVLKDPKAAGLPTKLANRARKVAQYYQRPSFSIDRSSRLGRTKKSREGYGPTGKKEVSDSSRTHSELKTPNKSTNRDDGPAFVIDQDGYKLSMNDDSLGLLTPSLKDATDARIVRESIEAMARGDEVYIAPATRAFFHNRGYNVPDKDITKWYQGLDYKPTSKSVRDEELTFTRTFEEQHGLSLGQARRNQTQLHADISQELGGLGKTTTKGKKPKSDGIPNATVTNDAGRGSVSSTENTKSFAEVEREVADELFDNTHQITKGNPVKTKEFHQEAKKRLDAEKAKELRALRAQEAKATEAAAKQDFADKAKQVDEAYEKAKSEYDRLLKESKEAEKAVNDQLKAAAAIQEAAEAGDKINRGLAVGLIGTDFKATIPGTRELQAAARYAASNKYVEKGLSRWLDTFQHSRARGTVMEVLQATHRGAVGSVIRNNLKELDNTIGQIPQGSRMGEYKWLRAGHPPINDTQKYIHDQFEELLPFFNGTIPLGGDDVYLMPSDVLRYLPKRLSLSQGNQEALRSGDVTASQFMNMLATGKNSSAAGNADPLAVLHQLRVAAETGLATRSVNLSLQEQLGVLRATKVDPESPFKSGSPQEAALRNQHGFKTLGEIVNDYNKTHKRTPINAAAYNEASNNTHLFPPELHGDIGRMLTLFEPKSMAQFTKFMDKTISTWKQTVTTYNPGYYTRNLVGEVMTAWFMGVNNPMYYQRSAKLIHAMSGEGAHTAALKRQFSRHALMDSDEFSLDPGKILARNGNLEYTSSEIITALHDQGIKSTFLNTAVDESLLDPFKLKGEAGQSLSNRVANSSAMNKASKAHDFARRQGEKAEDFPRIAHFIHKLEHAPKHMNKDEAIQYAAREVRKGHFDYSDVTRAEQAIFARAFPFYKWSRKALPLMTAQVFANPGKSMMYPKAMHALQEGLDPNSDEAGFIEEGLERGWMPNYFAQDSEFLDSLGFVYPIGDEWSVGMQTSQLDAIGQALDPKGTFTSMVNPFAKAIYEQARGEGISEYGRPFETSEDRFNNIADMTPQTKWLNKERISQKNHRRAEEEDWNFNYKNAIDAHRWRIGTGASVFKDLKFGNNQNLNNYGYSRDRWAN